MRLSVLGEHNIKNALAAAAASLSMGISPEVIAKALAAFTGVGRRMEYKGSFSGTKVYDDYAHHPSEVETTIRAVRRAHKGRIICVFQPHTYTRTAALKEGFAEALSLADEVILADIYAAREPDTGLVSAQQLANSIPNAVYKKTFEEAAEFIRAQAKRGDIVITMGAGDVYKVGDMLLAYDE